MRRQVKIFANFLGATKELTNEYVELAKVTEDEQKQVAHWVMDRPDRDATIKMLAAKNVQQSDIAEITGWSLRTVKRILQKLKGPNGPSKGPNGPSATGGREEARAEIAEEAAEEGVTEEPAERYRIIYADPPWDYGAHLQPDYQTEQRDHYPVMDLDAICDLPVESWAEDNAVLFLWATSPILEKAFEVVRAWGFEYKASFVWDKIKHNMGHYNSVRHEFLLVCTRGACQPDKQQLFDSVQSIERGKHSAKPVEFYDIIETLYTHGRRGEMFPRARRDGWDVLIGHVAEIQEAAE